MILMQTKRVSLPYFRIEHYSTPRDSLSFSPSSQGYAYLILGKTILREVPIVELTRLIVFAENIQKELTQLRVLIERTLVDMTIPESENPRVLWYPK